MYIITIMALWFIRPRVLLTRANPLLGQVGGGWAPKIETMASSREANAIWSLVYRHIVICYYYSTSGFWPRQCSAHTHLFRLVNTKTGHYAPPSPPTAQGHPCMCMAITNYLQIFGSLAKTKKSLSLIGVNILPFVKESNSGRQAYLKLTTEIHSEGFHHGKIPKSANHQSSDPQRMTTDIMPESIRLFLYKLCTCM